MSKVDIKRLDSITKNDTTATEQINDNFLALQQAIENTVSRDGTVPNYMDADLDLNSYRIINAGAPVNGKDVVTLEYFEEKAGGAIEAAAEAKASASKAASSAQSALVASNNAIGQLSQAEALLLSAEGQLQETQQFVTDAKVEIENTKNTAIATIESTVAVGTQEINTTIDEASMRLSDTIEQSVEDIKAEATAAANEAIQNAADEATQIALNQTVAYVENTAIPSITAVKDSATSVINDTALGTVESITSVKDSAVSELESVLAADKSTLESYVQVAGTSASTAIAEAATAEDAAGLSRTWATGTDDEVQAIEADEHSSRTYANFAMALANTAEDVPVLESTLLATGVIKGPKGDKGDSWNGGAITNSINVINDSNHPVQITGMAGTSATGYQIVDSNGAGDSDFEHLATGDRYITRIANHNNTSNTTAYVDLYQSNVGKSVLDASSIDTVLLPTVAISDNSQRGATTEFVHNYQAPIIAIAETSGNISLETNKVYTMSIADATVFALPASVATGVFNQIKVMIAVTGTPTVDWGTTNFFNKATPEIEEGNYDVYFDYDNLLSAWVCGVMAKGAAE